MQEYVDIGRGRAARRVYGLNQIDIVPSRRTRSSHDVDTSWKIDAYSFDIPVMTHPTDSIVTPEFAIEFGQLGGLPVINAEGLWGRVDDLDAALRGVVEAARKAESALFDEDDAASDSAELQANILASGVAMTAALKAKELLKEFDVDANVFSVTSWNELARDGQAVELEQLRDPAAEPRTAFITQQLEAAEGPFVAVSDYATTVAEQVRKWVPGEYVVLGADGFGFADTRQAARRYFNVDAESIVVGVLLGLAREGKIERSVAAEAAERFKIDDPTAAN